MSRKLYVVIALLVLAAATVLARKSCNSKNQSDDENVGHSKTASSAAAKRNTGERNTRPRLRSRIGAKPNKAATSVVSGRVLEIGSEAPVGGVDVTFSSGANEVTTTSEDSGAYTLKLAPGRYSVRAIADSAFARATPTVNVGDADQPLIFDIHVERLVAIQGRVMFSDGAAASEAEVILRKENKAAAAYMKLGQFGGGLAEHDGSFEIYAPAGELELRATKNGLHGFLQVPDVKAPGPVSGLRIVLQENVVLAGSVVSPDGIPIPGALAHAAVQIPRHWQHERKSAETDEHGRFRIEGLRPGRTVILAEAPDYAESTLLTKEIEPGKQVLSLELKLNPRSSLTGRVVDAEGNPISGALVSRLRGAINLRRHSVYARDDGRFELEPVHAGPHELVIKKSGFASLRDKRVMVTSKRIIFRMEAASGIRGTVKNSSGSPVRSFRVRTTRATKRPIRHKTNTQFMTKDGAFEINKLAPGQYHVYVDGEGLALVTKTLTVSSDAYATLDVVLNTL